MQPRSTSSRIERLRSQIGDRRRFYASASFAAILALAAVPVPFWPRVALAFAAIAVVVLAFRAYDMPARIVGAYDRAHAHWDRLIDLSDPRTALMVGFRLRAGETPYYSEMSTRFGEKPLPGSEAIPGSHVDPDALPGARARFGSEGNVYYGPSRRGKRPASAPAGKTRVYPVDSGRLSITSHRVVFVGSRETVDVALDGAASYAGIEGTERIRVEYPGRSAGESYSVDPILFTLSMVRRAHDTRFAVPAAPPPLGGDQDFDAGSPSVVPSARLIS